MPQRPTLQTSRLPPTSEEPGADLTSPARGKEMRASLLSRLRPPPLVHCWEFWHDRQDRKPPPGRADDDAAAAAAAKPGPETARDYEARLVPLAAVSDVRTFWEVFNNFDLAGLQLRDSVHLFHKGVKPVWEDPRNARGGAWTFRVPKDKAPEVWKTVALMAVGETLQACVDSKRISGCCCSADPEHGLMRGTAFIDDICGVSLSVRFTSILVQIWNRDGEHKEGIEKILKAVLEELPPDIQLRDHQYYYKKHSEHSAFKASTSDEPSATSQKA
jgi:hypothetical protein